MLKLCTHFASPNTCYMHRSSSVFLLLYLLPSARFVWPERTLHPVQSLLRFHCAMMFMAAVIGWAETCEALRDVEQCVEE